MGKADLAPQPMVYKAGQHTGAMIALFVPPDLARAIAVPGGEEPSELHCTLPGRKFTIQLSPGTTIRRCGYSRLRGSG